jgi:hypothetical protein
VVLYSSIVGECHKLGAKHAICCILLQQVCWHPAVVLLHMNECIAQAFGLLASACVTLHVAVVLVL